jgi:hypothetical protein
MKSAIKVCTYCSSLLASAPSWRETCFSGQEEGGERICCSGEVVLGGRFRRRGISRECMSTIVR